MLPTLMPIEETGETRVRTDCLNSMFPYEFKLQNKFQLEEASIGIIFFVGF